MLCYYVHGATHLGEGSKGRGQQGPTMRIRKPVMTKRIGGKYKLEDRFTKEYRYFVQFTDNHNIPYAQPLPLTLYVGGMDLFDQ